MWGVHRMLYKLYLLMFVKPVNIKGKNALVTGVTTRNSIGYFIVKFLLLNDVNVIISGKT